jgi:four helix bundle protein
MAKAWDLRERTIDFAVDVFKFCRTLKRTDETRDVVTQLRRSASSVAANTRALRRSQSDKVFVSKAGVIIEEADESGFWLEFLVRIEVVSPTKVDGLLGEANELVAIFTSSRKTVRTRLEREKQKKVVASKTRSKTTRKKASAFSFDVGSQS